MEVNTIAPLLYRGQINDVYQFIDSDNHQLNLDITKVFGSSILERYCWFDVERKNTSSYVVLQPTHK